MKRLYKYMQEGNKPESIFSRSLKGGSQTYFFDVKQAQHGKQSKYMQITTTRITKDQQRLRSSITIFPEQLEAFKQVFDEVREKVV